MSNRPQNTTLNNTLPTTTASLVAQTTLATIVKNSTVVNTQTNLSVSAPSNNSFLYTVLGVGLVVVAIMAVMFRKVYHSNSVKSNNRHSYPEHITREKGFDKNHQILSIPEPCEPVTAKSASLSDEYMNTEPKPKLMLNIPPPPDYEPALTTRRVSINLPKTPAFEPFNLEFP
ncbi:hypothetical protein BC833DRAFT_575806 [Globomyces pollinis-pini]|nr:hypothetical protein BC833DRAFT_575806 [Globomyces pollinis-pini]